MGRKERAFLRAIDAVMTAGVAQGHLGVSAAYVEGLGAQVVLDGGDKSIALSPSTALKLAQTWGSAFARAQGLGPIADDLKDAAEMAIAKGEDLRRSMN